MASKKKGKKVRTYRVRTDESLGLEIDALVAEMGEVASVVIREAVREFIAKKRSERAGGEKG